jgi:SAM-dependent methyltransferase
MGFYEANVLPRVTDKLLGNKTFARAVRAPACDGLHGDVVEVGFGSGLNMGHLPAEVTGLWAVEPSDTAWRLAQPRIRASNIPVTRAGLDGAALDLPDARFACALSTMTLCTIPDVDGALAEIRRVLTPGGVLHFADHGRSPDARVARNQDRFTPLQRRFAGGCHLNRDIVALVERAGFAVEVERQFYLKGPKAMGWVTVGRATAPGGT